MRIELGAIPPAAPISSSSITPVAEVASRMALALAEAELATAGGQLPTLAQQNQKNGFVPLLANFTSQPTTPGTTTRPLENPVSMTVSAGQAALPDRVTLTSVAASAVAASALPRSDVTPAHLLPSPLPIAAQAQASGNPMGSRPGNSGSTMADHLTLSSTAAAVLSGTSSLVSKPSAQFLVHVLEAIIGEPEGQVQLLSLKSPPLPEASTSYGPLPAGNKSADILSLFAQGTIRSLDQKVIPFGFSMMASRGDGFAEAGLPGLQAAQLLADSKVVLDYPGPAADLAGHSLNFKAVLDPSTLWPMQSFLMSGALMLGRARERDLEDELPDALDEEEPENNQEPPRERKKKSKPAEPDEPSPVAEDGGPPFITGRRWLELELRHLRLQMRNWMGLPE